MEVCLKDSNTLLEYVKLKEIPKKQQRFAAALVATRKIYEAICAHILRTMYGDNPQNGEDASSLFTKRVIRPFMNNAAKPFFLKMPDFLNFDEADVFSNFHDSISPLFHYNNREEEEEVKLFDNCLVKFVRILEWYKHWCSTQNQKSIIEEAHIETLESTVSKYTEHKQSKDNTELVCNCELLDTYIGHLGAKRSKTKDYDTIALYIRKSVECLCTRKLSDVVKKPSKPPALDEYSKALRNNHKIEAEPKKGHHPNDVLKVLTITQSVCNPLLHWSAEIQELSDIRINELRTYLASLIEFTINEEIKKSYPNIGDFRENEHDKVGKLTRKSRRWRIIAHFAFASIFLLLMIGSFQYVKYRVVFDRYYVDYTLRYGEPIGITKIDKNELSAYSQYYHFKVRNGHAIEVIQKNWVGSASEDERFLATYLTYPARISISYIDENVSCVQYFNATDELLATKQYNSSLERIIFYDGKDIDQRFRFGSDMTRFSDFNSPSVFTDEGYSNINEIHVEYTREGYEKSVRFFYNGFPSKDRNNLEGFDYTYDEMGRVAVVSFLYQDGKRTEDNINYLQLDYDDEGKLEFCMYSLGNGVNKHYFNAFRYDNHMLVEEVDGYQIVYTDEEAIMDMLNEQGDLEDASVPVNKLDSEVSYRSRLQHTRNMDGKLHVSELVYMDLDDNITKGPAGWAIMEHIYDEKNRILSEVFYDEHKSRCSGSDLTSARFYTYIDNNSEDNNTTILFSAEDKDGNLVRMGENAKKCLLRFNKNGQLEEKRFFDEDMNSACDFDGRNSVFYIYDKKGYQKGCVVTGLDGNNMEIIPGTGIYKIKFDYDTMGNLSDIYYLDSNDSLRNDSKGIAHYHYDYDDYRNISCETRYDQENKPYEGGVRLLSSSGNIKWAGAGELTKKYLGEEQGDIYSRIEREYDDEGRITYLNCYGYDKYEGGYVPACDRWFVPSVEIKYHDDGRSITTFFQNNEGRQMPDLLGISEIRYLYDSSDDSITISAYSIDMEPVGYIYYDESDSPSPLVYSIKMDYDCFLENYSQGINHCFFGEYEYYDADGNEVQIDVETDIDNMSISTDQESSDLRKYLLH